MAILEVNNLGKSFGSVEVLKDINFSLEKGESLAVIGSSGSGKTTMLRCLNYLETPDRGIIRVGGNVIFDSTSPATLKASEIRRNRLHFGMVFQSFNLFPQYTALQNVVLAGELLAKERPDFKENRRKILADIQENGRALLRSVGLENKMGNYPHQLSGGQQQRVAIARAIATNPEIIYFDEPTSALDPELIGEVLSVMTDLAKEGMTMLVVTHEMRFAKNVSNKVVFMEGGHILEQAPAAEFFTEPKTERARSFLQGLNGVL